MGLRYRFDFFLVKIIRGIRDNGVQVENIFWLKIADTLETNICGPTKVFLWNETFPYLKAIQKLINHIFEKKS